MRILKTIILIFKICLFGNISSADTISWSEILDQPKFNVIFLRHALAPGYGDPSEFDISDCKTQRNLNEEGRDQARSIGLELKMKGVFFNEIYSSEWCRCLETAILMDLGEITVFSGLNSFFQDHYDRKETLHKLMKKLEDLNKKNRILMVTHQVVISSVTGINVGSGVAVAYSTTDGSAIKISIP
ncbi:MAG: histidine phosphatase family protein [Pseudomonadota bacterium]|jgi:phosphohistidine phosphatase SixA|nr:histidine phosphatase family protein [Pseudomonadota bacterium]